MNAPALLSLLLCASASAAPPARPERVARLAASARAARASAAARERLRPELEALLTDDDKEPLDDASKSRLVEADLLLERENAPAERARAVLDAAPAFDARLRPAAAAPVSAAPPLEEAAALLARAKRPASEARALAERLSAHLAAHPRRAEMTARRFYAGRDARLRLAYLTRVKAFVVEDLGPFSSWTAAGIRGGAAAPKAKNAPKSASNPKPASGGGSRSRSKSAKAGGAGGRGGGAGGGKSASPDSPPKPPRSLARTAPAGRPDPESARPPRVTPKSRAAIPRAEAFDESSRRRGAPPRPAAARARAAAPKSAAPGATSKPAPAKGPASSGKGSSAVAAKTAAASKPAAGEKARVPKADSAVAPVEPPPPSVRAPAAPALSAPAAAAELLRDALNGGASRPSARRTDPAAPAFARGDASPASSAPDGERDAGGMLMLASAAFGAGLLALGVQTGSSALARPNSARANAR